MKFLMEFRVFVHSDDDIRLLRRIKRDVCDRDRTILGVLKAYNRFVKPSYDEYIKPVFYLIISINIYIDYEICRLDSS